MRIRTNKACSLLYSQGSITIVGAQSHNIFFSARTGLHVDVYNINFEWYWS